MKSNQLSGVIPALVAGIHVALIPGDRADRYKCLSVCKSGSLIFS